MPGHSKRPALEATPFYKDGRLSFSTPRGAVIALDANTGAEIWRVELEVRQDANYSEFTSRGLALRDDRLFIGTIDARLACLERENGQRCKAFGRNGESISPRACGGRLAIPANTASARRLQSIATW